jgi:hypothetical protein
MFFTDCHFEYVKKFIDHTYEQQKELLSDPKFSKDYIDKVKFGTMTYCTGYVVALGNFHVLSNGAQKVLEEYITKRSRE